MRDEYNISELNPRKNPYANRLKKQITINIDGGTIDYFKSLADAKGIPYQTLINLYLRDCADNHRQLQLSWQECFSANFLITQRCTTGWLYFSLQKVQPS